MDSCRLRTTARGRPALDCRGLLEEGHPRLPNPASRPVAWGCGRARERCGLSHVPRYIAAGRCYAQYSVSRERIDTLVVPLELFAAGRGERKQSASRSVTVWRVETRSPPGFAASDPTDGAVNAATANGDSGVGEALVTGGLKGRMQERTVAVVDRRERPTEDRNAVAGTHSVAVRPRPDIRRGRCRGGGLHWRVSGRRARGPPTRARTGRSRRRSWQPRGPQRRRSSGARARPRARVRPG